MERVGLLLTHGPDAKRDEIQPPDWAAVGTAGFNVLQRGPDALRGKLKAIQMAQPLDNILYRTRFRVFFDWLRDRDDDPDFDIIRDIVRDLVFRNFPIAKGQMVLGHHCPEQYVHALAIARSSFGISVWKLGRRLAAICLAQCSSASRQFILNQYVPTDVVSARPSIRYKQLYRKICDGVRHGCGSRCCVWSDALGQRRCSKSHGACVRSNWVHAAT